MSSYGVKVSEVVKILKQMRNILPEKLKSITKIKTLSFSPGNAYVSNSHSIYVIKQQSKFTFPNSRIKTVEFTLHKSCSKKEFVNFIDELIEFLSKYSSDYITFEFNNQILSIHDTVNTNFLRKLLYFCRNRNNPVSLWLGFKERSFSYLQPLWYKWAYDFLQEHGMQIIEYNASKFAQSIRLSNNLYIDFLIGHKIYLPLPDVLELDKDTFNFLFEFINQTISQFYTDTIATFVSVKHYIDKQVIEWISQLLFICNKSPFTSTSISMSMPRIPSGKFNIEIQPVTLFKFVDEILNSMIRYLLDRNVERFHFFVAECVKQSGVQNA